MGVYTLEEDQCVDTKFNLNIAIASAITSYSCIVMSPILIDPKYKIYYTDTYCIVMVGELKPNFIGKELGKFKLETIYKKGIFLGTKVYGVIHCRI